MTSAVEELAIAKLRDRMQAGDRTFITFRDIEEVFWEVSPRLIASIEKVGKLDDAKHYFREQMLPLLVASFRQLGLTVCKKSGEDYLLHKYKRVVILDSCAVHHAHIVEFPGCVATGDLASTALAALDTAAIHWINERLVRGERIPKPGEIA